MLSVIYGQPGSAPLDRLDLGGWLSRATKTVGAWRQRALERGELGRMSDRQLNDIGVGRAEAEVEIDKSFWQD